MNRPAAETGAAPAVPNRGFITVSIMLATIMQALDTTIANVALPHMQGSLSASQDQISWVLTSYIVAAAIMTPLTGWLAGRFGIKRVFLFSVAGFTAASVLCGLATGLAEMVVFRLLQGLCGAALVPLSQAVLLDINPRERHGQAMAIWGAGIMVGPILGPTLGGWLTDDYNWRWVFYINLPVGILAFLGILTFVRESEPNRARRFDFFGFAMLSVAVGALQLMLDRGEQKDWFGSLEIVVECALAACCLWVFLVHTLTAREPFVTPRLFTDRNFVSSLVLIFVVGVILYATLALLPPLLQGLMGYPVITTGEVLMPRGIGTMLAMLAVGRLTGKVDARLMLLAGLTLMAVSLWEMTRYSLEMDWRPVVWVGVVQGIGMGLVFVPLSTVAFATLPSSHRTEAAAMFSLIRNIGGSIGISMVVSRLSENTQLFHERLAAVVTPYNQALMRPDVQRFWDIHTAAGLTALNDEVTRQAAMIAYLNDFKLMMLITMGAIPLLLLLHKPQRRQVQSREEVAVAE
ncbi:MAG: DHA2 family efflux MFS transporter permease subunit [Rhodospirillaceae bacterium]|nr:DHA2 family efflux MFS transporter permease subunit [Rhodospirillaceae bacterium]